MIQALAIAALVVGVAAAAGGSSESTEETTPTPSNGGGTSTPEQTPTGGSIVWHDGRGAKLTNGQRKENYQAVYQMGKALENAGLFGPGFAEYLMVVSRTEARGNPAAGSDAFSNAARGMYGFRPTTGWNESATVDGKPRVWDEEDAELAFANGEVTGEEVRALKDLTWATALAAHNVSRLRKYVAGQPYTLLGARRGWAYPSLVPDHDNSERPELLDRWNEALAYFNLPSDFGDRKMQVLVSRDSFPHPAAIRQIILDAIGGEDPSNHNQAGFIAGSIEWGEHDPGNGFVYGWALGQYTDGNWSWAIDRYEDGNPNPITHLDGEVDTRSEASKAIRDHVEAWEASA